MKAGSKLWPGRSLSVYRPGFARTVMHFGAGRHDLYSCTKMDVSYSYTTPGGGLRVGLAISQVFFCGRQYYYRYYIKPRTNSESEYRLSAKGFAMRVKGPKKAALFSNRYLIAGEPVAPEGAIEGAITGDGKNTYFGVSNGVADVSSDQSIVEVEEGEVAKGNDQTGSILVYSPRLSVRVVWIDRSRAKFYSEESNKISVDGKLVRSSQVVWNPQRVIVETLTGQKLDRRVRRQWPFFEDVQN